jgi:hypothetical protein
VTAFFLGWAALLIAGAGLLSADGTGLGAWIWRVFCASLACAGTIAILAGVSAFRKKLSGPN